MSLEGLESLAVLRLLRLLRALKLLNAVPQLQIIVRALVQGMSSMGYISVIIVLVLYLFSIVAMILFSANDPWHFGTLHMAMLTLFQCATLDDWTDVMYVNMYGCDHYGYPWTSGRSSSGKTSAGPLGGACKTPDPWGWYATIFFVVFIVIGSLVLLTLFVGVVGISMDEAKRSLNSQTKAEEKLARVIEQTGVSPLHLDSYTMLFATLDLNDDKSLSREEIGPFLGSINPLFSAADLENVFTLVDSDGSGSIEIAEFVHLMVFFKDAVEQGVISLHSTDHDSNQGKERRKDKMTKEKLQKKAASVALFGTVNKNGGDGGGGGGGASGGNAGGNAGGSGGAGGNAGRSSQGNSQNPPSHDNDDVENDGGGLNVDDLTSLNDDDEDEFNNTADLLPPSRAAPMFVACATPTSSKQEQKQCKEREDQDLDLEDLQLEVELEVELEAAINAEVAAIFEALKAGNLTVPEAAEVVRALLLV